MTHPIYFALALLIGIASGFQIYLLPLALLFWRRKYLLVLALAAFGYAHFRLPPPIKETSLEGRGLFKIEGVKKQRSFFHTSWLYEGELLTFQSEKSAMHHLPVRVYLPFRKNRYLADHTYWINGTLLRKSRTFAILKPQKKTRWEVGEKCQTLTEWRFNQKERVRTFLRGKISDDNVFALLASLATGELEERSLASEFGRLGLSHILAISGFHFSLLTLFLTVAFRSFLSHRVAAGALIGLLTLFFLYMGASSSITRAWIGFLVPLVGSLFGRRTTPLRALSLALMIALLWQPAAIAQIGFQLSYAATFGILLLYAPLEKSLRWLLLKRTYKEALALSTLDKIGYLAAASIRHSMALNGAVALSTLPFLLYHFHRFPLLSLIYNFFFPIGITLSLFLLLLGSLLIPVPFASNAIYFLTEKFTGLLLIFTRYAPRALDFQLRPHHLYYLLPLILLTKRRWIRENYSIWRS